MKHSGGVHRPMDAKRVRSVALIGGGITGLSAAFYLERLARENGVSLNITLLEASERLGGKVDTERFDGFVMEKGPDSFLARKVAALQFVQDLGLEDDLVGTNPKARKTYILRKGILHRIPAGLSIGVPTQFTPFATTGLVSWRGKVRAALDLVLPKSTHAGDQSLGAFLERRLGREVVEALAEPLLSGIYAGDFRKLSLASTFPQYAHFEREYGSLIRGMRAQQQAARNKGEAAKKDTVSGTGNAGSTAVAELPVRESAFLSLRRGLYSMVEEVVRTYRMTTVQMNSPVQSIRQSGEAGTMSIRVEDQDEALVVEAVGVTAQAYAASALLPDDFGARSFLRDIPYASVATVILAYDASSVQVPLDGSGFVIPRGEDCTITACTWVSSKWLHTAPPGHVLIRCYVGRSGEEAIVEQSDEEIARRVRQDVAKLIGISATPEFVRITRWRQAMPQYTVGHLDRLKTFREAVAKAYPSVHFAGAGFTGVGVPDCIQQGKTMAESIFQSLMEHPDPV